MNIEERIDEILSYTSYKCDGENEECCFLIGSDACRDCQRGQILSIFSGWLSPEQVRERERKLIKKIEHGVICKRYSEAIIAWEALKEETEKG
jgi:hypothetical protein